MEKKNTYRVWLSYQCEFIPVLDYKVKAHDKDTAYYLATCLYNEYLGENRLKEVFKFHDIIFSPAAYIEKIND